MDQGASFTIGGKVYRLRFTAAARYLFNERVGKPATLSKWVAGVPDDRELFELILAGLEGHRLKSTPKAPAWTLSRVFALIDALDDEDDPTAASQAVIDATSKALSVLFPKPEPGENTTDDDDDDDGETEGKRDARGGSES